MIANRWMLTKYAYPKKKNNNNKINKNKNSDSLYLFLNGLEETQNITDK